MIAAASIVVPLWVALLVCGLSFLLGVCCLIVSVRRTLTEQQVREIIAEADSDAPVDTGEDWSEARHIKELQAQRDYWRESFIAWVRKGM